jgi:hypothetical protein
MEKQNEKPQYLRKLIDIPKPIVKELKKLALESDKSLKQYIQDIIVNEVEKYRANSDGQSDRDS